MEMVSVLSPRSRCQQKVELCAEPGVPAKMLSACRTPWSLAAMTARLSCVLFCVVLSAPARAADPWVVYEGKEGPGKGKHIVLISGDEEYRSEEALPQLGMILAKHHGFKCTVLFSINKKDGTIDPNTRDNIPGLEALRTADLAVFALRFRELPDEQMKHIVDYVEAAKPIIGLRTSTHAFNTSKKSKYARYHWQSRVWPGGFGKQVLGETWVAHQGGHGSEATRGILAPGAKDHPILRGINDGDIFGPTDVYTVHLPLPGDSKPLVLGQVVAGMKPTDPPVKGKKNDPMMPVAWVKTFAPSQGKKARVFTTTLGASQDLLYEGTRRMLVNACYWAVGLEERIPVRSNVELVGEYKPRQFRNNNFVKGRKPEDYAMK
jgi:hypothetical protein